MEPLLLAGDEALICPRGNLVKGDICAFEHPAGSLAVHRIVDLVGNEVMLKGDSTGKREVVDRSRIIGSVSFVRPSGQSGWHKLADSPVRRRFLALLSKHTYHDAEEARCLPFARAAKMRRSLLLHALAALNRRNRLRMIKTPAGSVPPHAR